MENASDAILIGGAMLILVLALTISVIVYSQAKLTIDEVLYVSDETNFYEFLDTSNAVVSNRIVSWETIIPTLYKYYKEDYTVVFLDKNGNGLPLYETRTNPDNWSGADRENRVIPKVVSKYPGINNNTTICSFDVQEEDIRREPWTGIEVDTKANIDAFLKGGTVKYATSQLNTQEDGFYVYNYGRGFIEEQGINATFRETIGEYAINEKEDVITTTLDQGIRNQKNKRVIVYQKIK